MSKVLCINYISHFKLEFVYVHLCLIHCINYVCKLMNARHVVPFSVALCTHVPFLLKHVRIRRARMPTSDLPPAIPAVAHLQVS